MNKLDEAWEASDKMNGTDKLDRILENFDTWDNCGYADCVNNQNFVEAKQAIEAYIAEQETAARIDELETLLESKMFKMKFRPATGTENLAIRKGRIRTKAVYNSVIRNRLDHLSKKGTE